MARFSDILSSLGVAEDGISTAYPETFIPDITSAYDDDVSVYAAKITSLEADLAEAVAKITALQVHNYELMTTSAAESGDGSDDSDSDGDSDDDTDDNRGVDSLFKEKETE
jgi:hypothetical protein